MTGRQAAAAETYLVTAVGLNRLRRSCCQWDAPATAYTETRAAWNRIATFQISVEIPSEEI